MQSAGKSAWTHWWILQLDKDRSGCSSPLMISGNRSISKPWNSVCEVDTWMKLFLSRALLQYGQVAREDKEAANGCSSFLKTK